MCLSRISGKLSLLIVSCISGILISSLVSAASVNNSVVSIGVGVSGTKGASIESFKVVGVETVNTLDLGREIQGSLFLDSARLPAQTSNCSVPQPWWLNPQDAGDACHTQSQLYAIGVSGSTIHVGGYPRDWAGRGTTSGLRIEGHHTVGPLPYLNAPEVVQLKYQVYWDYASGRSNLPVAHQVYDDSNRLTPVPFFPAAYFKGNTLTKLYGLSIDGTTWTDLSSTVASSGGTYTPSLYRFRAMAWMTPDTNSATNTGWGVSFYGRWTLNQNCSSNAFPMALSTQLGQCPNFAAQRFTGSDLSNNLSLIDQTLAELAPGTGREFVAYSVVGNLGTIKAYVNALYTAGY